LRKPPTKRKYNKLGIQKAIAITLGYRYLGVVEKIGKGNSGREEVFDPIN
jgi:hypothetical protein